MRILLLALVGLLAAAQVSGDAEGMKTKMLDWVKRMEEQVNKESDVLVSEVQFLLHRTENLLKGEADDAQAHVEGVYDRALMKLQQVPDHCKTEDLRKQLVSLKERGVGGFSACRGTLAALEDVAKMAAETIRTIYSIIKLSDDFHDSKCSSWLTVIPCYIKNVWTWYDDTRNALDKAWNYKSNMGALVKDLEDAMAGCKNNSVSGDALVAIMKPVHACAGQQVPVKDYYL